MYLQMSLAAFDEAILSGGAKIFELVGLGEILKI